MKYTEPKGLNHVADFHHLFDAPVIDNPVIPSQERCALRVNLLQEELNELKEAIAENDIVGVADALGDLQYVLSGAVHEFGLGSRFAAVFDEIQRSNMSKTCDDLETAEQTALFYQKEKGFDTKIVSKDGKYLVYRMPDHKVLKSIKYSEADLKSCLLQ